jgi:hypothetical protein
MTALPETIFFKILYCKYSCISSRKNLNSLQNYNFYIVFYNFWHPHDDKIKILFELKRFYSESQNIDWWLKEKNENKNRIRRIIYSVFKQHVWTNCSSLDVESYKNHLYSLIFRMIYFNLFKHLNHLHSIKTNKAN